MLKRFVIFIVALMAISFMKPAEKIKIFIAGDSTASIKDVRAFPEHGWGMPFVYFWDERVTVVNKAKNGRSTRSFREEGLWDQIMNEAAAGDVVYIQFGHNDEVPTKKTYTTETEFTANLVRFVAEARAKGVVPVLMTPVARRKFDSTGTVVGTHDVYSQLVRDVAKKEQTAFIDLDKKSQALYQKLGVEGSTLLFNHVAPGEHPNYPNGKIDDTHFSELGARKIAQLVLQDTREVVPVLNQYIIQPKK